MRSVVVYESMYGNTHLVADAIGRGLAGAGDVSVVPVAKASSTLLESADLIVIGGPTHAHGMTRERTRAAALEQTEADNYLDPDPDAEGEGLRDWFASLGQFDRAAAAFDTRFEMPALLTGRASKGISKRFKHRGMHEIAEPESFFVEKGNVLEPGEEARAVSWGKELGRLAAARSKTHQ